MEVLRSAINAHRYQTNSRFFVPELSFYKLMTYDAILRALPNSILQKSEVARTVHEHGRKIFGVLILADLTHLLMQFVLADLIEDARLPFKMGFLMKELKFSKDDAKTFKEKQWELEVPKFACGTLSRKLRKSAILPFIDNDDEPVGSGSFGAVYKTTIVPNHQKLGNMFPEQVR
jgi:hypothetical protein